MVVLGFLFLCVFTSSNSFIVPEELPSLLSLVYSNIPPIKKGTDSRLGVGFRLGEHADFQVLVELGPQTETKPIGVTGSTNKRNVAPYNSYKDKFSNTDGGKWLSNWSQQMKKAQSSSYIDNDELNLTSQDKPYLPANTMTQLGELYGASQAANVAKPVAKIPTVTNKPILTEAEKQKKKKEIFDDLSDVDLE